MATLYFNPTADNNWNTLSNWWQNAQLNTPALALPASGDSVVILSDVNNNSGSEPTVANLSTIGGVIFSINIIVTGNCLFNAQSSNQGTITGNATFTNSGNFGNITGNATFTTAVNEAGGTVGGNATFNVSDNSGTVDNNATFNGGVNEGIVNGNAEFNDAAANYGTIGGYGTFNGGSQNFGTITTNCTFNSGSSNNGPITGNVIFNGDSMNYAMVDGNIEYTASSFSGTTPGGFPTGYATGTMLFSSTTPVTFTLNTGESWGHYISSFTFTNPNPTWVFNGDSYLAENATIGGTATFNNNSHNNSTIDYNCTFNGLSFNNTGATVTGDCTFNGLSFNNTGATVTGGCTFNDYSYNYGNLTSFTIFNDYSINYSQADGATFNDFSQNSTGFCDGNTIFNDSSSSIDGELSYVEFNHNSECSGTQSENISVSGLPFHVSSLSLSDFSFTRSGYGINNSDILGAP